ncbi:MAG TPA: hypothetical protein VN914_21825 [Polyangia bacterium]|nr:hypothetical protein [Polyangia bacterium]
MSERDNSGGLVKYALLNQYNIIGLVGAAGLSLALESWIPVAVAVVGELLWLALASQTPGYRQFASEQAVGARRTQQAAETAQATRRLDDAYTARVNQLGRVADDVRRLAAERGMDPSIFERGGDRLQALVQTFIQMSALHQRLVRFLGGSPTTNLDEEVARLSKDMTAEKDAGVRLTLRQTLTVAQRRQKQHEQIEGTRRALEAKMRTLEMSLDFMRSQVFAGGAEADLENQLDELAATVSFLPDLEAEATATIASARSTAAHPGAGAPS